ncbi:hypothetical protein C3K47_08940 [Solitalea longa]|uniref:Band 7 domain-containing protein n=1 Tax=Solitalea longa TaxID=2079460 RepID=A0A2S5A3M0_9SPHI|nr:slipin family protein [Solitalea longa]POY37171.1 hypothetical protein C3K47_08940 [Solitalea longa]
MLFFKKEYNVKPNQLGFLYRENVLEKVLNSGVHYIYDRKDKTELICLPTCSRMVQLINQEVLTKDNISLRLSVIMHYVISDGELFLSQFELNKTILAILSEAEQRIYSTVQIHFRNLISRIESEELNEKRGDLNALNIEELNKEIESLGITIQKIMVKDICFPKNIQDLFAKQLEAKIRAKADLENARTSVATARTLKNASELMKGDENIKFFQYLEAITKIASKGNHTFMIGELQHFLNK